MERGSASLTAVSREGGGRGTQPRVVWSGGRSRSGGALWAACIGGAAQRDDYLEAIRDAGFEIAVVRDDDYRFISDRALGATTTYGVTSISLLATKH